VSQAPAPAPAPAPQPQFDRAAVQQVQADTTAFMLDAAWMEPQGSNGTPLKRLKVTATQCQP
jgi:hypothetical protein